MISVHVGTKHLAPTVEVQNTSKHKSFWSRSACMPWNMRITQWNHIFPSFSWLPSKWKRLTAALSNSKIFWETIRQACTTMYNHVPPCNVADMSWDFVWHRTTCISMHIDAYRCISSLALALRCSELVQLRGRTQWNLALSAGPARSRPCDECCLGAQMAVKTQVDYKKWFTTFHNISKLMFIIVYHI